MKQSTGLKDISSREGIIPLFMLLVSILILTGPSIGSENSQTAPGKDTTSSTREIDGNSDPEPTPSATEGPYFKPGSPERKSLLEPGVVGDRLNLTGRVLTRSSKPVAGSLLDFWQADGNGRYDNVGYMLRGHQFTDEQGRYRLETVVPGIYPGRTRHIHVKVQAPNGTVLTTQLFFPNEESNQADSIFNPELLVSINETEGGKEARFDFVLDMP